MTLIYIRWRDACHSMSQAPISSMGGLADLHEVGFLLTECDESITIGSESQDGQTEARFWLTVPKSGIVEIRRSTIDKAFPVRSRKR